MPIPLQADFAATQVQAAARQSSDTRQASRLLALAAIYHGASRTAAALIGGVVQCSVSATDTKRRKYRLSPPSWPGLTRPSAARNQLRTVQSQSATNR